MKIICPILNREETATEDNIAEIIPLLEGKHDPFLILEKDEITYVQTLWTPEGYDIEYQEGSILEHYWLQELVSKEEVIWALQGYLNGSPFWKTTFQFEKKEIASPTFKLGHKIGSLCGKIAKFFTR